MIVLTFPGCERLETVETYYQDFRTAHKANAVGAGRWIPSFLPESATDIHELHNLDTNEIWLVFRMNSADRGSISRFCEPATETRIIFPRKSPADWWPDLFVQNAASAINTQTSYTYYQCQDNGTLAVDSIANQVFYWRHL